MATGNESESSHQSNKREQTISRNRYAISGQEKTFNAKNFSKLNWSVELTSKHTESRSHFKTKNGSDSKKFKSCSTRPHHTSRQLFQYIQINRHDTRRVSRMERCRKKTERVLGKLQNILSTKIQDELRDNNRIWRRERKHLGDRKRSL